MFPHNYPFPGITTPTEPASETNAVSDWIASWPYVREDILKLATVYQQSDGGHDIRGFQALLVEADELMRLLKHRVEWLQDHAQPEAGS